MFGKKWTDDDISKASAIGYKAGYRQAIVDVNNTIDACAMGIVLKSQPEPLVVQQAIIIVEQDIEKRGELKSE